MIVTFCGTRGSVATPGGHTSIHGGNTTCIAVKTEDHRYIILDAGTGIKPLGDSLLRENITEYHIMFTHTHWDHVQGFPFFAPIYDSDCKIHIYFKKDGTIKSVLETLFNQLFHPISLEQLNSKITFTEFSVGEELNVCGVQVKTAPTNHPDGNIAYRLDDSSMSFIFTGDHEGLLGDYPALEELMTGVDAAAVDSMYSMFEYKSKKDWGHSHYDMWIDDAIKIDVKRLFFTHHNPSALDDHLDDTYIYLQNLYNQAPIKLYMAKEGYQISPHGYSNSESPLSSPNIMESMKEFTEKISHYKDMGTILDNVLLEARRLSHADAGTIYLYNEGMLQFSYVHNDKLFSNDTVNKFVYSNAVLNLDESTIAGYAAYHKKAVMIEDVYNIPDDRPYSFNNSFDEASGYTTHSILAVPILSGKSELMGIIQLINSKNEKGDIVPFTAQNKLLVEMLAMYAGSEIGRGLMSRSIILRMLSLTTLRDPKENEGHFLRVGAYAAAIFHRWAQKRGMDIDRLKYLKDQISIASMLHDVGKVGIPDGILNKPAKLSEEEFKTMTKHALLGADVFESPTDSLEEMACIIANYHHEWWNGSGYPDKLSGEEIPWPARIVAIADVFDALTSKRVYKEAWSFEKSINIIRNEAGTHFDPDMVRAFVEIEDTLRAIAQKYIEAT